MTGLLAVIKTGYFQGKTWPFPFPNKVVFVPKPNQIFSIAHMTHVITMQRDETDIKACKILKCKKWTFILGVLLALLFSLITTPERLTLTLRVRSDSPNCKLQKLTARSLSCGVHVPPQGKHSELCTAVHLRCSTFTCYHNALSCLLNFRAQMRSWKQCKLFSKVSQSALGRVVNGSNKTWTLTKEEAHLCSLLNQTLKLSNCSSRSKLSCGNNYWK